jgi:glycerol-3-phosphate cytidylyltransferase
MVIGYTTGVFDLFHIGHVNLLRNAKSLCQKLIVGVSVDDLVAYKNKKAVIPFEERIEIVRSVKYVDVAIPQFSIDKLQAYEKIKYNILFVGDDWFGKDNWKNTEKELKINKVKIIYLPYTKNTSSTLINETLNKIRDNSYDPIFRFEKNKCKL